MLDIVRRYSVGQKAKKILLLLASVAVLCAVIIVANTQAQKRKLAVSMDFIMDTVIEQKLYGKNGQQAVDEISRRLREYEQMCSMYLEESQVSQINQNAGKEYIEVSDQCLLQTICGTVEWTFRHHYRAVDYFVGDYFRSSEGSFSAGDRQGESAGKLSGYPHRRQ